jgi:hypothetical protein
MAVQTPQNELAKEFSSPDAKPVAWPEARRRLEKAEVFWLSTARPDGRPHVTPLIAVWLDDALYFCTGPDERKARNIGGNTQVVLTTGCNTIDEGLDIVVEGDAVRVQNEALLERLAGAYSSKYGSPFNFSVRNGTFLNAEGGEALVFEVRPRTAFGFAKGEQFGQTRWRF